MLDMPSLLIAQTNGQALNYKLCVYQALSYVFVCLEAVKFGEIACCSVRRDTPRGETAAAHCRGGASFSFTTIALWFHSWEQ